jgi:hypothetical protein
VYVSPVENVPAIIDRLYELIKAGDIDRLAMLYSSEGEIVRYDGVASSPPEIRQYYRAYLGNRPGLRLRAIDKLLTTGNLVMWDALLDSDDGILQTIDVVILDDEGLIHRHIPGFRGYWGR